MLCKPKGRPNLPLDHHRVFGGQLLAQAIVAATPSRKAATPWHRSARRA
ncbi:MAG: hypothetical protein GY772_18655 [bacterium]|jgi:acyl-CoA thioesterase|nr:hypothetical protein [bacterium]|tara:strand:- start:111 stop:257 length:147 start_codon:yes stop_codon:yes gene_type:complete